MRRALRSIAALALALTAAPGLITEPGRAAAQDTQDAAPDTTAPDTTAPDTTAPETAPPDAAAPDAAAAEVPATDPAAVTPQPGPERRLIVIDVATYGVDPVVGRVATVWGASSTAYPSSAPVRRSRSVATRPTTGSTP